MRPEESQRKKIIDYINSMRGCKAIVMHTPLVRGNPDIFASIFGVCTVIEVKLDDHYKYRKGQELQRNVLKEWKEAMADAYYLEMPTEWGAFRSFLDKTAQKHKEREAEANTAHKIAQKIAQKVDQEHKSILVTNMIAGSKLKIVENDTNAT